MTTENNQNQVKMENRQDAQGFFDTLEMKEIMDFLDEESSKSLTSDKIETVAQAWSHVDRKKLFKN